MTYYLHTLDGMPAVFVPNVGVCFATFYGPPNKLARSLKQIRKEQKESQRIRKGDGIDTPFQYGYRRVTP